MLNDHQFPTEQINIVLIGRLATLSRVLLTQMVLGLRNKFNFVQNTSMTSINFEGSNVAIYKCCDVNYINQTPQFKKLPQEIHGCILIDEINAEINLQALNLPEGIKVERCKYTSTDNFHKFLGECVRRLKSGNNIHESLAGALTPPRGTRSCSVFSPGGEKEQQPPAKRSIQFPS